VRLLPIEARTNLVAPFTYPDAIGVHWFYVLALLPRFSACALRATNGVDGATRRRERVSGFRCRASAVGRQRSSRSAGFAECRIC
jgi:hypothetical protein